MAAKNKTIPSVNWFKMADKLDAGDITFVKKEIMKQLIPLKKEAVYLCKSKEEQDMLYEYMILICGFKPISGIDFKHYPAFSVTVQSGDYDTLILSVPKYSPAFDKYDIKVLICNTLDEFMMFLDYYSKNCE